MSGDGLEDFTKINKETTDGFNPLMSGDGLEGFRHY